MPAGHARWSVMPPGIRARGPPPRASILAEVPAHSRAGRIVMDLSRRAAEARSAERPTIEMMSCGRDPSATAQGGIPMTDKATATAALPTPHPRLREFERFIGTWDMAGRTDGSEADNVRARATFEYLPGGFFVVQRFKADFDGMPIESLEVIGYDPASDTFPSTVYAN